MTIKFKKIFRDAELPSYATEGSAGMDLRSMDNDLILLSGEAVRIRTGLAMALPIGYEAQIRPRSGLAIKHGITVINSPGTIDSDYRGEIIVGLINVSDKKFTVTHKMRIAQIVIARYHRLEVEEVSELDDTDRGEGGFGSTGLK